ncbi:cupin domain-containing protein [Haloarculaceae archaeon H-GB2-1]|nr:cupin domain-containing protein [Haloarculaceae archaeon H-GB1-1]MEA5386065.1 cupin domain-containing protein [Haloarculaceae archaeon H-GB11]MEA5407572.1 cupin domain-containing protein [Haloarculaceae archaeon H-GB2-1]
MALDRYPDLEPDDGEVLTAEVAVSDDVLVKAFALGPGGEVQPHEHDDASNVFHVLEGTVTVVQGEEEESVTAPGVVFNERGVAHGARNESDDVAVLTASLCPLPS